MTSDIRAIGEISGEGVFILDSRSRQFLYVNEPFAAIFDLSPADLMADSSLLLPRILSEDFNYIHQLYEQVLSEKAIQRAELRLVPGDAVPRYLQCDAYLMNDGIISGFIRDISAEKEHEEYMVNYGAKKDTLLDMLAHNLSGPLYLTQNILTWMQENYRGRVPAELTSQLELVQSTTQECVDIVNDFMHEEHTESERIFVKKTRFDLMEKILSILDKLAATNRNKTFRVIARTPQLNVTTDSVKFFQAIHNLLSNSIKFTADGGEIDIIVEEREHTIIVSVRDNGIGIPAGMKEFIFLKNQGLRRTGLKNEPSGGLGLGIVKSLVTLLEGRVEFESVEGEGSTFSIEIPKN